MDQSLRSRFALCLTGWLGLAVLASVLGVAQTTTSAPPAAQQPGTGCFLAGSSVPTADHVEDKLIEDKLTFSPGLVEIPVTVKDAAGRLVENLPSNDFAVYEDGVPQKLNIFSSAPFPLSAAILAGTELPAGALDDLIDSLPALMNAFKKSDEVAFYRYSNFVEEVLPFTHLDQTSARTMGRFKGEKAQVLAGPLFATRANVLNDAILRAAQDLSRREKNKTRRIIVVIGDGYEYGSTAQYPEVLKFLLSHDISVYALVVETADAAPGGNRSIRKGNARRLESYVSATGGDSFAGFNKTSLEHAYPEISNQARSQYTLGYASPAGLCNAFRSVDVHVHHPDLWVAAKSGYYLVPPDPVAPSH